VRLNPQDLEKIADLTLEHYNRRAEDFWEGTRDHDVSQQAGAGGGLGFFIWNSYVGGSSRSSARRWCGSARSPSSARSSP
jgi:hypothetical protein